MLSVATVSEVVTENVNTPPLVFAAIVMMFQVSFAWNVRVEVVVALKMTVEELALNVRLVVVVALMTLPVVPVIVQVPLPKLSVLVPLPDIESV